MNKIIIIDKSDNVAVALCDIVKGDILSVDGIDLVAKDNINLGNKIALSDISENENIIKYGYPIGRACKDIKRGQLIHTHNIVTRLDNESNYVYQFCNKSYEISTPAIDYFYGYERSDGSVGIRNEIWIIPMVGCVNSVCKTLETRARAELAGANIDDIITFTHQFGCSQLGDDHNSFQILLKGLANNPNAQGVLFVALGCENNTIESFKELLGNYDQNRIRFMNCQASPDEIEEGMTILEELVDKARTIERKKTHISKLIIGLKCGGSDGLSGITANPVIGAFSDILISQGGSTILTEIPEMFGAEQLLMSRCADKMIFDKLVNVIDQYKEYYINNNQPIYENPSPGNKQGGISTLEEKSLGCVLKGGNSIINQVLGYSETDIKRGLNIMSAPGNDLIASTALAASGCHMILFSTGRGTPFSTVVPTLKISSNCALNNKKSNWIDFNAGVLLVDNITIEELGMKLYNYVVEVANGQKVKSEIDGLKEMAFFKNGVTL